MSEKHLTNYFQSAFYEIDNTETATNFGYAYGMITFYKYLKPIIGKMQSINFFSIFLKGDNDYSHYFREMLAELEKQPSKEELRTKAEILKNYFHNNVIPIDKRTFRKLKKKDTY